MAMFLIAGCTSQTTDPAESAIVVSGLSFPFCAGYCTTELVIDDGELRYTESSRDSTRYPPRTRTQALSAEEWSRLRQFVDLAALETVVGTHGCPGCADGGIEWLEIRSEERSPRATFEHGQELAPIRELQREVRALRERFR
jgi:hypothetical protein